MLGAVLTTPEVITQIIMFVPLQLLYEISIWIAWYWERQDKKREAAARQRGTWSGAREAGVNVMRENRPASAGLHASRITYHASLFFTSPFTSPRRLVKLRYQ